MSATGLKPKFGAPLRSGRGFNGQRTRDWAVQTTVSYDKLQQVTVVLGPQAAALSAPTVGKRTTPFGPSMPPGLPNNARG